MTSAHVRIDTRLGGQLFRTSVESNAGEKRVLKYRG